MDCARDSTRRREEGKREADRECWHSVACCHLFRCWGTLFWNKYLHAHIYIHTLLCFTRPEEIQLYESKCNHGKLSLFFFLTTLIENACRKLQIFLLSSYNYLDTWEYWKFLKITTRLLNKMIFFPLVVYDLQDIYCVNWYWKKINPSNYSDLSREPKSVGDIVTLQWRMWLLVLWLTSPILNLWAICQRTQWKSRSSPYSCPCSFVGWE